MIWEIVSQCNSIFATFAIFAIGVSQCFAKFRKSCFASFANTSFARFRKYKFRSFTFVSQDSQGFANTIFRKLSQIKFSQGFANRFFVSQGFASFARFSRWAVCWCSASVTKANTHCLLRLGSIAKQPSVNSVLTGSTWLKTLFKLNLRLVILIQGCVKGPSSDSRQ